MSCEGIVNTLTMVSHKRKCQWLKKQQTTLFRFHSKSWESKLPHTQDTVDLIWMNHLWNHKHGGIKDNVSMKAKAMLLSSSKYIYILYTHLLNLRLYRLLCKMNILYMSYEHMTVSWFVSVFFFCTLFIQNEQMQHEFPRHGCKQVVNEHCG